MYCVFLKIPKKHKSFFTHWIKLHSITLVYYVRQEITELLSIDVSRKETHEQVKQGKYKTVEQNFIKH